MKIKSVSILTEHGYDSVYLNFLDSHYTTHDIDLKKTRINYDNYFLIIVNEESGEKSYYECNDNEDFKDIIAAAIKINLKYKN